MLTQEQQQIRSTGVGASEIGALLGLDPYRGPLQIYERKRGLVEDQPDTSHTLRGKYLEPSIIAWASDVIGVRFAPGKTRRLVDHPLVLATPDGEADGVVLEVKCPSVRTAHEWSADEAPDRYVAQVEQQMLVTGASVGHLVAYVGDGLLSYRFERDSELDDLIIERIERFWADHVVKGEPPAPLKPGDCDVVRRMFPRSRGEMVTADSATESLIAEYHAKIAEADKAAEECEALKARLQLVIGDKDGLTGPWGKITWRNNKDSQRVDWEQVAREVGAPSEVINKHTTTKPGPRVFRASWAK